MAITATAEDDVGSAWRRAETLPFMSEQLVSRWAALLHERTGMAVPGARRSHLVTGVALRMRELGLDDPHDYMALVNSGRAGTLEWAELIDRLTVQETRFFRDPSALRFVADVFLPEAARRLDEGRAVQVWSAGCATGEESYTLAMLLDRRLGCRGPRAYYGVVGSDISLRALATARAGVYSSRRVRNLPPEYRAAYCSPHTDGRYRISEGLRRRVCFMHVNLLASGVAPVHAMDLVFCQNVLIYFDRAHRRSIVERLVERLRPGGYLVLGAGEMLGLEGVPMRRVGAGSALVYRRDDG